MTALLSQCKTFISKATEPAIGLYLMDSFYFAEDFYLNFHATSVVFSTTR